MESDRFDYLVRSLVATGSRRRAILSAIIGAGSLLGGDVVIAGGNKNKNNKNKNKNNKNKNDKKKDKNEDELPPLPKPVCKPQCGSGQQCCEGNFCCPTGFGCDFTGGENSHCCAPPRACEGLCCSEGYHCCVSVSSPATIAAVCCSHSDEICHPGTGDMPPACCEPGKVPCHADDRSTFGCCNTKDPCCTMTDGTPYCCSGDEGLTCKKTASNTCQKA
jgi:hypothetical protein